MNSAMLIRLPPKAGVCGSWINLNCFYGAQTATSCATNALVLHPCASKCFPSFGNVEQCWEAQRGRPPTAGLYQCPQHTGITQSRQHALGSGLWNTAAGDKVRTLEDGPLKYPVQSVDGVLRARQISQFGLHAFI